MRWLGERRADLDVVKGGVGWVEIEETIWAPRAASVLPAIRPMPLAPPVM
jgi:hypothetical protein